MAHKRDDNPRPSKRAKSVDPMTDKAAIPLMLQPDPRTIAEFIRTMHALYDSFPSLVFLASHTVVTCAEDVPGVSMIKSYHRFHLHIPAVSSRITTMTRLHMPPGGTTYRNPLYLNGYEGQVCVEGRVYTQLQLCVVKWIVSGLPHPCPYETVTWSYAFNRTGCPTEIVTYQTKERSNPLRNPPRLPSVQDRPPSSSLPAVVFGNGGCRNDDDDCDKTADGTPELVTPPCFGISKPSARIEWSNQSGKSFLLARCARTLEDVDPHGCARPRFAQEILNYTFRLRTAPNAYRSFATICQYITLTAAHTEGVSDATIEHAICWLYLYGHILIGQSKLLHSRHYCVYLSVPHDPVYRDLDTVSTTDIISANHTYDLKNLRRVVKKALCGALDAEFENRQSGVSSLAVYKRLPQYDRIVVHNVLLTMEWNGEVAHVCGRTGSDDGHNWWSYLR